MAERTRIASSYDPSCASVSDVETPPVLLLSLLAGGVGLNLAHCRRIIIIDATYNPTHRIQAAARICRAGQMGCARVFFLWLDCETSIDANIAANHGIKTTLAATLHHPLSMQPGDPCVILPDDHLQDNVDISCVRTEAFEAASMHEPSETMWPAGMPAETQEMAMFRSVENYVPAAAGEYHLLLTLSNQVIRLMENRFQELYFDTLLQDERSSSSGMFADCGRVNGEFLEEADVQLILSADEADDEDRPLLLPRENVIGTAELSDDDRPLQLPCENVIGAAELSDDDRPLGHFVQASRGSHDAAPGMSSGHAPQDSAQDIAHMRSTKSTSGYVGVQEVARSSGINKYQAFVTMGVSGKKRPLGTFDDPESAARAVAKARGSREF